MSKSNNAYIKKQKELQRKKNSTGGSLENMLAYVDEFGNLTSQPPLKKSSNS